MGQAKVCWAHCRLKSEGPARHWTFASSASLQCEMLPNSLLVNGDTGSVATRWDAHPSPLVAYRQVENPPGMRVLSPFSSLPISLPIVLLLIAATGHFAWVPVRRHLPLPPLSVYPTLGGA